MFIISNILIINLKKRTDLWENLKNLIDFIKQRTNIHVQRIEGVYLKDTINHNPLIFNNFILSNLLSLNANGMRNKKSDLIGEIGCYLSHKECWETIVSKQMKNTLILEDGILFDTKKFNENIDIQSPYDIIFANKEMTKQDNYLTGYGLQAYILSNNGARKLLSSCSTLYFPIDLQIREICNQSHIIWKKLDVPFVQRNHNRLSSISEYNNIQNEKELNDKQNTDALMLRIIKNMIKKNVPLLDYI